MHEQALAWVYGVLCVSASVSLALSVHVHLHKHTDAYTYIHAHTHTLIHTHGRMDTQVLPNAHVISELKVAGVIPHTA